MINKACRNYFHLIRHPLETGRQRPQKILTAIAIFSCMTGIIPAVVGATYGISTLARRFKKSSLSFSDSKSRTLSSSTSGSLEALSPEVKSQSEASKTMNKTGSFALEHYSQNLQMLIKAQRICRRVLYRKHNFRDFNKASFGPRDTTTLNPQLLDQGAKVGIVSDPLPPLRSNAIIKELADEWVEMHPAENRAIAQKFLSNIRNYSFEEFVEGLSNSIERFNLNLMSLPPEERDYILLIGPWNSRTNIETRSNSWVASLSLKYLAHPPTLIMNYNNQIKQADCRNISRFLFVDDASYSGAQICNTISDVKIDLPATSEVTIHFVIPFISYYARKRIIREIEANRKVNFVIEKHTLFPNIERIFTREERIQLNKIRGVGEFNQNRLEEAGSSLSLTYFEHKIPDAMSTFTETLERGQLLAGPYYKIIPPMLAREGIVNKEDATQAEIEAYNKRYSELVNTHFHRQFIPHTLPPYKVGKADDLQRFLASLETSNVGTNPVISDYNQQQYPPDRYVVFNTVQGVFAIDLYGCQRPTKLS